MTKQLRSEWFLLTIMIIFIVTLIKKSDSGSSDLFKKGSTNLKTRETMISKSKKDEGKEKKYLTYLPHSGLSNQRIELQNALIMAAILNRTLIIPPAFLGNVYNWNHRKVLMDLYEWLTLPKEFDQLCPDHHLNSTLKKKKDLSSYVYSSKCHHYYKIGMIQWSELHDLEPLSSFISFQYMDSISLDYILSELGLKKKKERKDQEEEKDLYIYNDTFRYDWRIFEDETKRKEKLDIKTNYVLGGGRRKRKEYYQIMNWEQWKQRPEKLLYLGSVFGSSRLNMQETHHLELKKRIIDVFHYRLDTLLGQTVQTIINDYLGGKKHYLGTHFRMQDKTFRQYTQKQIQAYHQSIQNLFLHHYDKKKEMNHYELLSQPSFCRHVSSSIMENQSSRMINIYMATDDSNPKQSQELQPWFHYYPCTITLHDIPEKYFQPLDNIVDLIHPKKSLRPFLMPIIDTMITANAYQIYLNPGSTFSGYIGQLHKAWSN
ncbi:unnamed protein product [Cunninghamella blakesleeana]